MSGDFNPYAAPESAGAVFVDSGALLFVRDGKFLAVRDGAELPQVCLLTNEPVDHAGWRRKVKLAWTPQWVFVLLLINILVLLIVMLCVQKKGQITYSLCGRARGGIVRKRSMGFLLLVTSIGLFAYLVIYGHSEPNSLLPLAASLVALVSLIASLVFFIIANPVKVVKFKNGWFRIKGCSPEFLASLPEYGSPF